ncbi:Emopamil-binding protein [Coniochaeta hoffmannii]|uniref:Emopamil-binding protein n=1 Tax=Coniochaeta hoffmannii TaxID=91930 RepID=A0AA38RZY3_9PEZI|nr:Emopamil-binding protein [Coniochaeta hoffmannii]
MASTLPPDLFDQTTLISLGAVVAILLASLGVSRRVLAPSTPSSLRVLFIWHAFDALIHFIVEGSFLYHCFFSSMPIAEARRLPNFYPDPHNYLGHTDRVHGSQAGGQNPFAQMWMVYAKADKRWAGVDLAVVSLELLTVFVVGPMAVWVCYDIAKKNLRYNIVMVILATAELYGGFITFCPEWLVGNINLDTSNFMYKWVYLVFFNTLWVWLPIYAIYIGSADIMNAFRLSAAATGVKKTK